MPVCRVARVIRSLCLCLAVMLLAACQPAGDPRAEAAAEAARPQRKALAAGDPVGIGALLDWAERTWAQLFPAGPATQPLDANGLHYELRQYPATGNAIGVAADGTVWGLGPFNGNVLTAYGHKDDYLCLVSPWRCDPQPATCRTTITTGFSGDLNATYESPGGGSGDGGGADGGGVGGDGAGGSAGVGGSEGKVLGGRFRVYRLADGVLLAQGLTDTTQGLATLTWCAADLPVLLELQGAPGALYFDEALNRLVEFPLTQKLRALVDRFDENVGVSALTEAAYLYALNQWRTDVEPNAPRPATVLTDGVPVGLTAAQVRLANQRVLDAVNNRSSDRLQQVSMKALATPLDAGSDRNALPRNRYGRIAALTGGFAKTARSYNADTPTPALTHTRQFALDFSDGRLDEFSVAGQPVAAVGQRAYQGSQVSLDLALGQGAMGQRFGQATTRLDGEPYVDFQFLWLERSPTCTQGWGETAIGYYYLSTIGTVTKVLTRAPPGGCIWDPGWTRSATLNLLTGIRKLVPGASDRMFAITTEGELWGWGWSGCGRIGNGVLDDVITPEPVKVRGISRVVDMGLTGGVNLALTADGEVWSWGVDYGNAAGQGTGEGGPTCSDRSYGPAPYVYNRLPLIDAPRRIPGLSNIVALAVNMGWSAVSAVDSSGRLYQWGQLLDATGRLVYAAQPRETLTPSPVTKISAAPSMFFGITRGGRVLTWWLEPQEIFEGERAADVRQPKELKGVTDVVDLVSDAVGGTLALRADGTALAWGRWATDRGDVTLTPRPTAQYPVYDANTGLESSSLPRLVRLTVLGGLLAAIGADGLTYRFVPGPALGAFRWSVNDAYAGLPSPY
jgi:hypothetical protein